MLNDEVSEKVKTIANPILSAEGLELVDVEYRRESRGWILRLYIDKEGGITVDDCARTSREIGRTLDVEDLIPTAYTLEVSSPGLTRPLKDVKDFLKYRNRLIKVRTFAPVGGQRQFKGRLLGFSEKGIQVETEGRIVEIPLSNVAKANLEVEW